MSLVSKIRGKIAELEKVQRMRVVEKGRFVRKAEAPSRQLIAARGRNETVTKES